MSLPSQSYLVCATPRSGSSFLCGLLTSTHVAGRPEEYFWRNDEPFWAERWNVNDFPGYLSAALSEGTTPNGVFAAKVMWGYFGDLMAKLTALPGHAGLDDAELLDAAFPGLTYLFNYRRDTVAQAVSFARAIQTNQWSSAHRVERPPTYDFDQIHQLVHEIEHDNQAWKDWFSAHRITPYVVCYEDLRVDMDGTTLEILDFLDVDHTQVETMAEQTTRQADTLNAEWTARYYDDLTSTKRSS